MASQGKEAAIRPSRLETQRSPLRIASRSTQKGPRSILKRVSISHRPALLRRTAACLGRRADVE